MNGLKKVCALGSLAIAVGLAVRLWRGEAQQVLPAHSPVKWRYRPLPRTRSLSRCCSVECKRRIYTAKIASFTARSGSKWAPTKPSVGPNRPSRCSKT